MSITVEQVIATLEQVVAEKGEDYVYPHHLGECRYAEPDGSPSCIVGYVVAKLDPTKYQEFVKYENQVIDKSFGIIEAFSDDDDKVDIDIPSMPGWDALSSLPLERAQSKQDNGATWGEALTAAKATL